MARALVLLALLAACRSTTTTPETSPPRFAVLTRGGIGIHEGASRTAVPHTEDVETFCWNADGTAFLATTGDALIHVTPDGRRRVLSRGWFAVRFPTASPDGRHVAVSGRRTNTEPWGVWTMRVDAKGPARRLVDGYDPAWNADGRRIYYERFRPRRGLSFFDLGSGETQTFMDDGRGSHTVTCSPSGRMILFTRGRALVVLEPGNATVRELTGARTYNRFPSVSPGERYVIYFRQDPSGETHPENALVILDLQNGAEQIVDVPAELAQFAPSRG
jgi:Tol biopolymer transport system component